MNGFDDPDAVARYTANPPRLVPGFADLQKMTRLLLAETAPADGRVLVVGAGGGLELKAFAQAEPGWRFVGVDPSSRLARPDAWRGGVHAPGRRRSHARTQPSIAAVVMMST